MCECDFEMPDVFHQKNVKAKKFHRCDECRGWIEPGESYLNSFGIWDGSARTYKTCSDCREFADWAEEQHGDDICYAFGNMVTDIGDCLHEMGDKKVVAEMSIRWREVRAKRRTVGIGA